VSFVANKPSPILNLLPTEVDARDYIVSDVTRRSRRSRSIGSAGLGGFGWQRSNETVRRVPARPLGSLAWHRTYPTSAAAVAPPGRPAGYQRPTIWRSGWAAAAVVRLDAIIIEAKIDPSPRCPATSTCLPGSSLPVQLHARVVTVSSPPATASASWQLRSWSGLAGALMVNWSC
jgi:hypothetical protein